jgi:predicted TPR repeat methyltransferase
MTSSACAGPVHLQQGSASQEKIARRTFNSMNFAPFDKRGYPVVSAQTGYEEWADHYDATVAAGLDRPLLDALKGIPWHDIKMAADLACGTGRIGVWLSQHGVRFVDGVDFTPEMLQIAESKNVYRHLRCADVAATDLPRTESTSLANTTRPGTMRV